MNRDSIVIWAGMTVAYLLGHFDAKRAARRKSRATLEADRGR